MTHNLSPLCLRSVPGLPGAPSLPLRRLDAAGRPGVVWLLGLALTWAACLLCGRPAQAQRGAAAPSLKIDSQVNGNLVYWFVNGANTVSEPTPIGAKAGQAVALTVPDGFQGTTRLRVVDVSQGKVAHLNLNRNGATPLRSDDFTYAESVQIPVKYKDKPAQGVLVELDYQDHGVPVRKAYWLQSSDGGVAHFADVPLGSVKVLVSDGKSLASPVSGNVFQEKPGSPFRFTEVTVPSDYAAQNTEALAPAGSAVAAGNSGGGSAYQPTPGSNNVISIVTSVVVGVLVLAVLLFWLIDTGRLKPLAAGPVAAVASGPSPFQPTGSGRPAPIPVEALGGVSASTPVTGPRLVATMGSYAGSIFPLTDASTGIGRDIANNVALTQDTAASRRHAHIQINNGQYMLTDDGSSNGTFVNGIRIASQSPKPLRPGDEVQIGTTRFRFEV